MAISLNVADWKKADTGNGFTHTIDAPNNVSVGDLIVVGFNVKAGNFQDGIDTIPAGFTEHARASKDGDYQPEGSIVWKIAEAGDVTDGTNSGGISYSFTVKDDWHGSAISMRITGHDSTTPLAGSSTNAIDTAVTSLNLTSINGTAGNILMALGGLGGFNIVIDTMTAPTGMTKQIEQAATSTNDIGTAIATQDIVTTGATGDKAWTWTEANPASGILFQVQADSGIIISGITQKDGVTLVPEGTAVAHMYADDNSGTNEVLLETKYTDINGDVTFDLELPMGKVRFTRAIYQQNGNDVVNEQFYSN